MRISKIGMVALLCVMLLGAGCQRKGIPCPKPGKASKVSGKGATGPQAIRVDMDKNGRVKKKKGIF